jgi:hypothetical protein
LSKERNDASTPQRDHFSGAIKYSLAPNGAQTGVRVSSMFELATALMALFSTTIFVAHAVDAFRAE